MLKTQTWSEAYRHEDKTQEGIILGVEAIRDFGWIHVDPRVTGEMMKKSMNKILKSIMNEES
jgi:hypothetical protein